MTIEIQNRLLGVIPIGCWTEPKPGPVKLLTSDELSEILRQKKECFLEAMKMTKGGVLLMTFAVRQQDGSYPQRLFAYPPQEVHKLNENKVLQRGLIRPRFRNHLPTVKRP